MRKVKAKRSAILDKIRANYKQHVADYAEAFEQYKVEITKTAELNREIYLADLSDLVQKVNVADITKDKPAHALMSTRGCNFGSVRLPMSHAKDYEQVIMMLEMEVADEIELEADQFSCYVMDDWSWKEEFRATSEFYKNNK